MRRAVLVRRRTPARIQPEHLVLQRLKRLENLVHPRVKPAPACRKRLPRHPVVQPHVLRRANQRSPRHRRPNQQRQPAPDRRRNPEVIPAVRRKIQSQVPAHRRPVQKMRLIQRRDLPSNELRMLRQLPQQPRFIRRRPRHKRRLQGMHQRRMCQVLRNLVIRIPPPLRPQLVQQPRGHDHHFAILMRLHQVNQPPVTLRPELPITLHSPRRHPRNEPLPRKFLTEPPQHFPVQLIAQIEYVPGVRIQH